MQCTSRRHLYDVDEGGQFAVCLCGKGDRIEVPDLPAWAAEAADIVPARHWRGTIDEDDITEATWRAEVHDAAYDGSCEVWVIEWGVVELEVGDLTLRWTDDEPSIPEVMRSLRRAMMAFG
jgi:hypothetical protein